ncbi:C40 family peptidase [Blastococcus tunisiensis]|uniref:Cell wall-associated hydrolase, NlpC family n=1 Tax=Blastococcus tunisiensis TaxID=1798228 RepID=A0A1I2MEF6_9ACTN|nr:C40 family peptidase [Blastococcus sp. DSM 46838]SFF89300.1 Cell wall-associated hydrolase, NlpC family [Blastococcus sp. DSM 46838]
MSEQAGARFGTQRRGAHWVHRLIGAGAVAVICLVGAPGVAAAAPRNPSDAQLSEAQRQKAEAAERVGAIAAQLAQARADAESAHQAALIALQDYEDKQAAYETARIAADTAAAAADQAAADLQEGRKDVAAFARASYMQGTTAPAMTALLSSGGPAELVQRAALLDAAGVHKTDVLSQLTVLEVQAGATRQAAVQAVEEAETIQTQAAELLASAQTQEVSARAQADAIDAEEDGLQAELQQAEQVLYGLEGARTAAEQAAARQAAVARPTAPAPSAPAPQAPRPTPSTPAGPPSASAAQTAIAAAQSQIGVAYSWGGGGRNGPSYGISPDTAVFGFDCSGLTEYAYARAGISIGGTSRDQWWLNRTKQVATANLQPGDLLFWGGDRSDYMSITHVALYIGNGQMIEAPDRGKTVTIATARTSSSTYFGAVRPSA